MGYEEEKMIIWNELMKVHEVKCEHEKTVEVKGLDRPNVQWKKAKMKYNTKLLELKEKYNID